MRGFYTRVLIVTLERIAVEAYASFDLREFRAGDAFGGGYAIGGAGHLARIAHGSGDEFSLFEVHCHVGGVPVLERNAHGKAAWPEYI